MSSPEEQFLQTLRATFKVEANEQLQTIGTALLDLEKVSEAQEQRRFLELAFRASHSLKGAARAVNFSQVESICQSLEDEFALWKSGKSAPTPAALDAMHQALNRVSELLSAPASEAQEKQASGASAPVTTQAADKPASMDSVRISVAKLDARLLEAEEMLSAKLAVTERSRQLSALRGQFEPWRKEWARVQSHARGLRVTPQYTGVSEFLEWAHDYMRALEAKVVGLSRDAERDRMFIGKLVDDLLEDSKQLLMLPFGSVTTLFPKLVRDLCRDQGKEAELVVRGEDVEVDKRILEEMKDALIHLLRNSVDHGIELPEQRRAAGKVPRATITVAAATVDGNQMQILISDDGAGVDVAKLKASAIQRGVLTMQAESPLSDADALQLMFAPDVSTSPIITQLSGRGLGLAIVREKTEKLGGHIRVESSSGAGTIFRISLPLTLATFRGIQVRVAERVFVVPTAEVERVARVKARDVRTVEGRETIEMHGRAVSLVRLADVLGLADTAAPAEPSTATPIIILGANDARVAFAVDAVLDEQEVLIKQLQKPLVRVRHIAGATVLGSGQVAPVLRVADLLRAAKHGGAPGHRAPRDQPLSAQAKAVLIAEDSITSRMLLKGILEAAGYRVKTAVDGMEAYTTLRSERFDLLVSDVEMPRLNGFDLTARVRADSRLAQLPVVLVTALETREDRERGIDVGANAYLVKSDLDQSNLLETVRRFI